MKAEKNKAKKKRNWRFLLHRNLRYYMHEYSRTKREKNKRIYRATAQSRNIFWLRRKYGCEWTGAVQKKRKANFFDFSFEIIQCKHMYTGRAERKGWEKVDGERKFSLFMTFNSFFYSLPYHHNVFVVAIFYARRLLHSQVRCLLPRPTTRTKANRQREKKGMKGKRFVSRSIM